MKLYIARDKDGSLNLFKYRPFLKQDNIPTGGYWCDNSEVGLFIFVPKNNFPEVTFENSPQQVELKLIKE